MTYDVEHLFIHLFYHTNIFSDKVSVKDLAHIGLFLNCGFDN